MYQHTHLVYTKFTRPKHTPLTLKLLCVDKTALTKRAHMLQPHPHIRWQQLLHILVVFVKRLQSVRLSFWLTVDLIHYYIVWILGPEIPTRVVLGDGVLSNGEYNIH